MKTFIADSFTKQPFKGNPAAVCFPQYAITEAHMQQVAFEMGLSETAFVQPAGITNVYTIRYFSPVKEIPLCGHATLAAAKVIFSSNNATDIHFLTIENLDLTVTRSGNDISMEFPVYNTAPATAPPAMLTALGLSYIVNTVYSEKQKIIMLEIDDADTLAKLKPDFNALVQSHKNINGVLVTAQSDTTDYDYHYRYFWPWAGTNEDPVTGGVQTFLAKYWGDKLHKKTMQAFQSSARTGYMQVDLMGEKVLLTSQAVIVLEGNLLAFE